MPKQRPTVHDAARLKEMQSALDDDLQQIAADFCVDELVARIEDHRCHASAAGHSRVSRVRTVSSGTARSGAPRCIGFPAVIRGAWPKLCVSTEKFKMFTHSFACMLHRSGKWEVDRPFRDFYSLHEAVDFGTMPSKHWFASGNAEWVVAERMTGLQEVTPFALAAVPCPALWLAFSLVLPTCLAALAMMHCPGTPAGSSWTSY